MTGSAVPGAEGVILDRMHWSICSRIPMRRARLGEGMRDSLGIVFERVVFVRSYKRASMRLVGPNELAGSYVT